MVSYLRGLGFLCDDPMVFALVIVISFVLNLVRIDCHVNLSFRIHFQANSLVAFESLYLFP